MAWYCAQFVEVESIIIPATLYPQSILYTALITSASYIISLLLLRRKECLLGAFRYVSLPALFNPEPIWKGFQDGSGNLLFFLWVGHAGNHTAPFYQRYVPL